MEINRIVKEVYDFARKYKLQFVELDRTDNIVSMRLLIDNELFIQVYGNAVKDKLNLTLVFKKRRLYGYDFEGNKYHYHPFDNPDDHIFIDERKSIEEFIQDSMKFLEENELL